MPNRIIKESICTSDTLAKLTWFDQCLFFRLIVLADDYGRYDGRAAIIKGQGFPLNSVTDKQIEDSLSHLASAGIVDLYSVGGKPYLQIETWEKHQRVRNSRQKYPAPETDCRNSPQLAASRRELPQDAALIQSESLSESESESNSPLAGGSACAREAAPTARQGVIAAYVSRINPTPSETCIAELTSFCDSMGAAVCLRAMDIALDEKKTAWSYIRAILLDKKQRGVRSLADWDALAQRKEPETGGKRKSWTEIAAEMEAGK